MKTPSFNRCKSKDISKLQTFCQHFFQLYQGNVTIHLAPHTIRTLLILCSRSTENEKQPTFHIETVMDYTETHTFTGDPWSVFNLGTNPAQGSFREVPQLVDLQRVTAPFVAGGGLEPPASGLWARRATNCSIPRYWIANIRTFFETANFSSFIFDFFQYFTIS